MKVSAEQTVIFSQESLKSARVETVRDLIGKVSSLYAGALIGTTSSFFTFTGLSIILLGGAVFTAANPLLLGFAFAALAIASVLALVICLQMRRNDLQMRKIHSAVSTSSSSIEPNDKQDPQEKDYALFLLHEKDREFFESRGFTVKNVTFLPYSSQLIFAFANHSQATDAWNSLCRDVSNWFEVDQNTLILSVKKKMKHAQVLKNYYIKNRKNF